MSRAKASFKSPESGQTVGTFLEHCHRDDTATATGRLTSPQTITGTQRLEVYSTLKDEPTEGHGRLPGQDAGREARDAARGARQWDDRARTWIGSFWGAPSAGLLTLATG